MSVIDSFLRLMKLNDDDEMYDDYDDYEDDEPIIEEKKSKKITKLEDYDAEERGRKSSPKPVVAQRNNSSSKKVSGAGMEVCVIKPTSVEDAREITETLLANRTVVLNMEGLDVDIAQRIIDFASGSCFAISGNLQKISHYIFIITPASVDISGDFQEILSGSFQVQGARSN